MPTHNHVRLASCMTMAKTAVHVRWCLLLVNAAMRWCTHLEPEADIAVVYLQGALPHGAGSPEILLALLPLRILAAATQQQQLLSHIAFSTSFANIQDGRTTSINGMCACEAPMPPPLYMLCIHQHDIPCMSLTSAPASTAIPAVQLLTILLTILLVSC